MRFERIGGYHVTAKIGQGGMGEVYRARDTKLDRDVALKVLPQAFTDDPDRLARFEREAKVLASLNHPNIGHIYGLEEAEGQKALVLELVEGPTLAERIKQGPIPVDEALPIAKQIAEALEAAHEQGIIHRDLKPANVKVKDDGTVKVLDFGLAKAFQPDASDPNMSQSPTISLTAAATQMGMVIGTAAYMAPEQASGKAVDKRADVWAFGVVLYEMLVGTRPFVGDDVSKTLARVIDREPDWSALPKNVPPVLGTFLRGCLEKDPRERVRDIGDVRLAMKGVFETTVSTSAEPTVTTPLHVWQRPIPLAAGVLVLLGMAGLIVWTMMRPVVLPSGLVRFSIVPPETDPLSFVNVFRDLAISPDGTQVVYKGPSREGTGPQLNLRPIDQLEGAPLRGGEGGLGPFVSPDGEWVGFVPFTSLTTLLKVSIFGGPPVTLTESPYGIAGASWGVDDQIIFGTLGGGLFRVSGGGGEPEALTTLDTDSGEGGHYWPSIIPGANAVLFVTATAAPLTTGQLAVLDLDTEEVTPLGLAGVSPHYVSTGHLVYAVDDGSVRPVPFDAASLTVTGNPVPLIEGVSVKQSGAANFSLSDNGRLVYALGAGGTLIERSLVWVDREGGETPIPAPPREYVSARVSPDGTRVALSVTDQENDIWVWNTPDGPLTRLTFAAELDIHGLWTPDGDRVVFSSRRDGDTQDVYWKVADGTGTAERVTESDNYLSVNAVTPDGTLVIARVSGPSRDDDLTLVTLDGDTATETLVSTEFNERNAALSPDGAWVAFQSDESGVYEVYVRPFPDVEAGRWQVSTAGGRDPVWSPDGRELFFRQGTQLLTASVQPDASFSSGTPEVLFDAPYYFGGVGRTYDVAPDGRFLIIKSAGQPDAEVSSPEITVVLNWHQELIERVPIP